MKLHHISTAVLALASGASDLGADELGHLDVPTPGVMVSVCGGLSYGGSARPAGNDQVQPA
jgi:hypothetical protein